MLTEGALSVCSAGTAQMDLLISKGLLLTWSYGLKKILALSVEGRVASLQTRMLWTNVSALRKGQGR